MTDSKQARNKADRNGKKLLSALFIWAGLTLIAFNLNLSLDHGVCMHILTFLWLGLLAVYLSGIYAKESAYGILFHRMAINKGFYTVFHRY